jgi:hypothetical protein
MASNLKLIWVRVSDEDFERLLKKAGKMGLSLNNYLRRNAGLPELKHGGAREYTPATKLRKELAELDGRRLRLLEALADVPAEKHKKKETIDAA